MDSQPGATGPGDDGTEDPWDDVAAQFSDLGRQLRDRIARRRPTTGRSDPSGRSDPTGPSEDPTASDRPDGDAVRRAVDALDDAFTSIGDAVRDPAFRREASTSIASLGEALGTSLQQVGEQLQRRFAGHRGGEDPWSEPPPSTDVSGPGADPAAEHDRSDPPPAADMTGPATAPTGGTQPADPSTSSDEVPSPPDTGLPVDPPPPDSPPRT